MKRLFKRILYALTLGILSLTTVAELKAQPGVSVTFQMFYDQLAPHGQWIDDPEYGYVWAPNVGGDFRPYYTNGRWVMTDYGNTWISNYDWGWAPFHYGRWTYDSFYGWVWIPGDQWGPAWVSWRQGGGYYGWAPLGPGVSVSVSFGNSYYAPYDWWTFIPYQHIYSPNYYSYWRGPQYNTTIFNQTTIINNYYNNRYIYGPGRSEVERHVGRVNIYQLRDNRTPGRAAMRRNQVTLYRPEVVRNDRSGNREAPRQVVRARRPIETHNAATTGARQNVNRQNERNRDVPARERNNNRQQIERQQSENANRIRDARREQERAREVQQNARQDIRQQRNNERMQTRNEQQQRMERQREDMRGQREQMMRRENEQRMQMQRQRAERDQMMNQNRARQEEMRRQEMRNREQIQMQRQHQMQEQRRQIQDQRQQQMRQQREWRRPEPQQRMERQRMEPARQRARPGGRER